MWWFNPDIPSKVLDTLSPLMKGLVVYLFMPLFWRREKISLWTSYNTILRFTFITFFLQILHSARKVIEYQQKLKVFQFNERKVVSIKQRFRWKGPQPKIVAQVSFFFVYLFKKNQLLERKLDLHIVQQYELCLVFVIQSFKFFPCSLISLSFAWA